MFTAIAEPTRRSIVEMLAECGQLSASSISSRLKASPPAVSQHLKILRDANVLTMEKRAQHRIYRINASTMRQVEAWANRMAERWEESFSALDGLLENEKAKQQATFTRTEER